MANNRGSSPALADHWFVVLQNALDAWGRISWTSSCCVAIWASSLSLPLFPSLPSSPSTTAWIDYISQTSLHDVVRSLSSAVPAYARVHSFTRPSHSFSSLSRLVQSLQRLDLRSSQSHSFTSTLSEVELLSKTAISKPQEFISLHIAKTPQTVKMHFSMKTMVLATLAAGQAYAASIGHQHSSAHSHARKHNHVEQ